MKKLIDLLSGINILNEINISDDMIIGSIVFDSRKVVNDSLFVATSGTQVDGHDFIQIAIDKGAKIIICEKLPDNVANLDNGACPIVSACPIAVVQNSQVALGILAANFYNHPSRNLKVVGITGTNGKTSTTTMLYHLFTNLGFKVGLLSTIQIRIGAEIIEATHTTPDAVSIQKSMSDMVAKGCTYCFMEVSSHAIEQDRIAGIDFVGGVFTNITHDHLDYHLTFANYINAKKKFFDNLPKTSFAITNIDDKNGRVMMQNTSAKVKTMAMHTMADYRVKILDASLDFMTVIMDGAEIVLKLAGEFNAYNALASYAVATELGIAREDILTQLSRLDPVEGRIDIVQSLHTKVRGVIDYAHTPDAVEKLLEEINKINKNGQIITVIGCGGNRDKAKRPIMAQLAAKYSHRVILTSDNPRGEDPKQIVEDMKLGLVSEDMKKTLVVLDRAEAIKTACLLASDEDIIALVGKGHEKYQEINGIKIPFDDKMYLKEYMELIETIK
jgi:UDP-N-acetylmuramoyl-L-alanyl-D-glutamate--2,6-diaminopimelate ligase